MNWLIEKKINIIYLISSILLVLVSYLINTNFRDDLPRKLSESIFWLVAPILIFSVLTFFIKKATFSSWKNMTNYFFIFSIIIILITPTSTYGLNFSPITKETVTIILVGLYSFISLSLILYKSFKK